MGSQALMLLCLRTSLSSPCKEDLCFLQGTQRLSCVRMCVCVPVMCVCVCVCVCVYRWAHLNRRVLLLLLQGAVFQVPYQQNWCEPWYVKTPTFTHTHTHKRHTHAGEVTRCTTSKCIHACEQTSACFTAVCDTCDWLQVRICTISLQSTRQRESSFSVCPWPAIRCVHEPAPLHT